LPPIAFFVSLRGLVVDACKWFAIAGGLLSGGLLGFLVIATAMG
jgi:hypothetical protein